MKEPKAFLPCTLGRPLVHRMCVRPLSSDLYHRSRNNHCQPREIVTRFRTFAHDFVSPRTIRKREKEKKRDEKLRTPFLFIRFLFLPLLRFLVAGFSPLAMYLITITYFNSLFHFSHIRQSVRKSIFHAWHHQRAD